MPKFSRFIVFAAVAAIYFGLFADIGGAADNQSANVWGIVCNQAEDKKSCCSNLQIDCAADCMRDYKGEAINTCKKVCARKGKACGNAISKAAAPKWQRPTEESPTDAPPPPSRTAPTTPGQPELLP